MTYEKWIEEVESYLQDLFGDNFGVDWLKRVKEIDLEIQAFYCIDDKTLNKVLRLKRILNRKGRQPVRIPSFWYPDKISDKAVKRQQEH